MADRRNLSIPINLSFLVGLLAASHLATAMSPTQAVKIEMSSAQPVSTPPPAVQSGENLSDAVMTLATVAMPALPDIALPETPVTDVPVKKAPAPQMAGPALAARPDQYTPTPIMQRQVSRKKPQVPSPLRPDASGPNPPDQPSITPMKTSTVAAPVPAVPLSRGPKPAGTAPKLMPLGLPGEGTQAGDPGSDATPIPSLAPMAPNRPQPVDVVERAQPVGDPAMSLAANGRLGQVTSVPATISGQSQFVKPQASDLQAAGRLMDDTARKLSLEFLWPADRRSHSRIYSRLTGCLGVETGIIGSDRKLYLGTGGGRVFNAALQSPFMRVVDQPVDPRERRNIERIRTARQITAHDGTAVRVFRRAQDIRLLAALNRAFGGLPTSGRVTAEYQIEADALYLGKLTLNGRRHDGRVRLDHDRCS